MYPLRLKRDRQSLEPNATKPLSYKAWLLATCPDKRICDGNGAVPLATLACEIDGWRWPGYLAILAAACAEASDFTSALQWQENALYNQDYATMIGATGQERLKRFHDKIPWRDE